MREIGNATPRPNVGKYKYAHQHVQTKRTGARQNSGVGRLAPRDESPTRWDGPPANARSAGSREGSREESAMLGLQAAGFGRGPDGQDEGDLVHKVREVVD